MNSITRQALYDLVWSKPTRLIALDLGISDVWIAKLCKRFDIPKPPPGYWRKLETGRPPHPTPLPALLPFEPEYNILLSEKEPQYRPPSIESELGWDPPENLTDPLPALPPEPELSESAVDERRSWGMELTRQFKFKYAYTTRKHPAIRSAIQNDKRRTMRFDEEGRRIKLLGAVYQTPEGAALLKKLHYIFWALDDLGAAVWGPDYRYPYWFETRALRRYVTLVIVDYKAEGMTPPKVDGHKAHFGYGWVQGRLSCLPVHVKVTPNPIPESVDPAFYRSLIADFAIQLQLAEHQDEADRFLRIVALRNTTIDERKKHIEALEAQRRDLIQNALIRIADAERLRALIHALDSSEIPSGLPDLYSSFREWAQRQLNEIDPRLMSLDQAKEWLESYQFDLHIPLE